MKTHPHFDHVGMSLFNRGRSVNPFFVKIGNLNTSQKIRLSVLIAINAQKKPSNQHKQRFKDE